MEPIPETTAAINELNPMVTDDDLLDQLVDTSERVRQIVPDCIGLSVTMLLHGITFTLVTAAADLAVLDAIQYLDGGPCVQAVDDGTLIAADIESMDEEGWHLFADATAAHGVRSTLSMPLMAGDEVIGGVNFYGASRHAFEGHHEELAEAVGAWAGGTVTNADMSFDTRLAAQRAPEILRQAAEVDVALGMLAALLGIGVDEAHERLQSSAARAGTSESEVARMLSEVLRGRQT